jgi:uncharacterized protein YigE (DUF2233 family)
MARTIGAMNARLLRAACAAIAVAQATVLAACGNGAPPPATITPEPTRTPTALPVPEVFPTFVPEVAGETPVAALQYDGMWREIKPGLEAMLLRASVGRRNELVVMVRVDPALHAVRVHYDYNQPRLVRKWFDDTLVDVAINAGFFLDTKQTAGLLIVNGAVFGRSYTGFGGMFAMRGTQASIRWLRTQPYEPDASITYAVQSLPMLVQNGRVVQGINDDGERNRRSFVAVDRNGRVLLGVGQTASWTLTDLANFLARTPALEIDDALNLDGGASSGMWVRGSIDPALTNSLEAVPSVITVGGS